MFKNSKSIDTILKKKSFRENLTIKATITQHLSPSIQRKKNSENSEAVKTVKTVKAMKQ